MPFCIDVKDLLRMSVECCDLLKKEGYATDPAYPAKLKGIIAQQGL